MNPISARDPRAFLTDKMTFEARTQSGALRKAKKVVELIHGRNEAKRLTRPYSIDDGPGLYLGWTVQDGPPGSVESYGAGELLVAPVLGQDRWFVHVKEFSLRYLELRNAMISEVGGAKSHGIVAQASFETLDDIHEHLNGLGLTDYTEAASQAVTEEWLGSLGKQFWTLNQAHNPDWKYLDMSSDLPSKRLESMLDRLELGHSAEIRIPSQHPEMVARRMSAVVRAADGETRRKALDSIRLFVLSNYPQTDSMNTAHEFSYERKAPAPTGVEAKLSVHSSRLRYDISSGTVEFPPKGSITVEAGPADPMSNDPRMQDQIYAAASRAVGVDFDIATHLRERAGRYLGCGTLLGGRRIDQPGRDWARDTIRRHAPGFDGPIPSHETNAPHTPDRKRSPRTTSGRPDRGLEHGRGGLSPLQ